MLSWLAFLVVAAVLLTGAIKAVTSADLVHTVLWLALVLVGTAVAYVVLQADFLAAVQVLLYTGGVITLMLFAVMLTRRRGEAGVPSPSRGPWRGLSAGLAVLLLVATAVIRTVPLAGWGSAKPVGGRSAELGARFLGELALPFEVLSLLLLAAMIGAIVLARREGGRRPAPLRRQAALPIPEPAPAPDEAAHGRSK